MNVCDLAVRWIPGAIWWRLFIEGASTAWLVRGRQRLLVRRARHLPVRMGRGRWVRDGRGAVYGWGEHSATEAAAMEHVEQETASESVVTANAAGDRTVMPGVSL